MFDQLSDRLQATLSEVRSRGKLNEADVDRAMREIRLALLEADVNFKVVKSFTTRVKERCIGAGVLESLDPGQQVVKIVNEELASLMGGASRDLALASSGPTVILMAGLQGSGKTTACAKLAKHLAKDGKDVALAACDLQRPAAVDQLVTIGKDAGNVAEQFADRAEFDGVVLTKLDGDARGGAALSVKAVTGKPILYASTGEKLDQLERFHPERMASRILGMGDVLSLIEKAEQSVDQQQAADLERKIRKQQFTLEDFLQQMRQVRRMGPLTNLLGMM